MPDRPVTVRDVFELPAADAPEEIAPRWQTLREWISQELNGAKAPSMDEIADRVGELLEIPISTIFLNSWKKTDMIREILEESRTEPESVLSLELDEHSINSQHRPYIVVGSKKDISKKLEFRLRLIFRLNGFVLKVANGIITEMQPGSCEMRGTLEYQGLVIAEKHPGAVEFPERVELEQAGESGTAAGAGAGTGAEIEAAPAAAVIEVPAAAETVTPQAEVFEAALLYAREIGALANPEIVEAAPRLPDIVEPEAMGVAEPVNAAPAPEPEPAPISAPAPAPVPEPAPAIAATAAAGALGGTQSDASKPHASVASTEAANEVDESPVEAEEREEFVL